MKTQFLSYRHILMYGVLCIGQTTVFGAQNLLINGDFENPVVPPYTTLNVGDQIPGWTVVGAGDVHLVNQPSPLWPGNPSQFMDLTGYTGGAGIQSDAFPTIIGRSYQVAWDTFNGSLTFPGAYNGVAFTLQATGNAVSSYSVPAGFGESLVYDFVAASTTTTLTFMDASGYDSNAGWIDNVTVEAVPEPTAFILLAGIGLCSSCWCSHFPRQRI